MLRVDPHKYGQSILLAVSGGADSITMATLAYRHFDNVHDKLAIAHCNFNLRSEESDADEAFVREWARERGLKCYVKSFDTLQFAGKSGQSIEMAARELRYRWFDELCKEEKFDGVCVAHNANDNAETLFLNLLRGTGLRGLCGMSEVAVNPFGKTKVFRPMLGISREEIESYVSENGISFRTDSSNLTDEVKRNRIRNNVFPILKDINPSFINTLSADIVNFAQAQGIVEEALASARKFLLEDKDLPSEAEISIPELLSLRHWKYVLFDIMDRYGFNPAVIRDLQQSLESLSPVGGKRFLSENWQAVCSTDRVVFVPSAGVQTCSPSVVIEKIRLDGKICPKTDRGTTIMDASCLESAPAVRKWKEGDWLCPLGMHGKRKKVSDVLTDLKFNLVEKEKALVVEGEDHHVLAIVGERVDESVKVTSGTTEIYRISKV